MKKNLFILAMAVTATSFTSCAMAQKSIVPSKNYVTRNVEVASFDGIATSTSIDVVYTQTSGSPKVEIYAPDNLMEYIQVRVKDGVLHARFFNEEDNRTGLNIKGKHETEVRVHAPAIHSFSASSSGDIVLKNGLQTSGLVSMKSSSSGDIEGDDVICDELVTMASSSGDIVLGKATCTALEAKASSSGDVEIKLLKAETVSAEAASSGDVVLAGECRTAQFAASSSGDVEAKHLKADNVNAKASSSGDVTCHAVESLTASTSSSGSVNYKGDPKHID